MLERALSIFFVYEPSPRSGPEREPSASPTRSPLGRGVFIEEVDEETINEPKDVMTNDFFGDELRGYRLLKAAKLASSERQHVLTLTRNSTRFIDIRRALRTLFSDDPMEEGGGHRMPRRTVWWSQESPWEDDDGYYEEEWWDPAMEHEAYWADDWGWDDSSYMDGYDYEDAEDDTPQYDDMTDLKDSPEGERYQEAYTIAKEAHKTLAEARQAVAKVRAARGYFDSAGMKGTAPSKGKGKGGRGKGKGKPKGGAPLGPCFICGSYSHGYVNCPDRWQASQGSPSSSPTGKGKGKMKSKSKKGKPKGKTFYSYDYFVEIEKYDDLDYVNVLSLQDDDGLQTVQDAKVIIDTGATESVAGVTCMARLLDRIKSNYKVCLSDRPKFKFGNGMVQRATSRVDIFTKALGDVSFYLLDGTAEFTPPLLGGKELWYRQALVAYGGEYLVHRSKNGKWWLNRLTALRGKHIALDMNEKSEPLDEALQRMRNGPSEEEPDEEEDEEEDDGMGGGPSPRGPPDGDGRPGGGDGHGDDHDGQDPVRQMVEATAASVTRPARSREARTAETRDAAAPTVTRRRKRRSSEESLDETPLDPPGTHAPLCGHPECRGRVLCRELPLFDGRARSEKLKGRFGDSRGGTADESERSRSKSRDGSRMRHENRDGDDRNPGQGSTGSTGAVFMMSSQCTSSRWHGSGAWHDGREPLRDRLASLAQRLQGLLKTRIDDDQCPSSVERRGSSTHGMAMQWSARGRSTQSKSVGGMDGMQEMRCEAFLCGEERHGGRIPLPGVASELGAASSGRAPDGVYGRRDDGQDLSGQDHGGEGPRDCGYPRTGCARNGDQGQRPTRPSDRREPDDGLRDSQVEAEVQAESGSYSTEEAYVQDGISDPKHDGTGNTKDFSCVSFYNRGGDCRGGCGCGASGDHRGRAELDGVCHGDPRGRRAGVKGLWDALTSLRRKMQAPDLSDPNPLTDPPNTDTRQPFPNDSVKESSTGTTTTFDTTKDILSTANVNQKEI